MSESPFAHVDTALLSISEARERVEGCAKAMRRTDADPRLIAAVDETDRELLAVHHRLMQTVYFGVSSQQLTL